MPETPDPADALAAKRRTVLFTAIGAVLAAALLFAIVARVMATSSSSGGGSGGGGSNKASTFDVGPASQRAAAVDRDGPFLFPDPRGGSRDIYVQHLGGEDWVAFEARVSGAPRRCVLRWEQGAHHFVDPCDGRIYPADGTGLVSFPTTVNDKGRVIVDLGSPRAP